MARSFPDLTYSQDALTHLEVERVVSSEDGAKCFDSIGIKDSILVDQKKNQPNTCLDPLLPPHIL